MKRMAVAVTLSLAVFACGGAAGFRSAPSLASQIQSGSDGPSHAFITLSPDAGPPGTVVTLHGFIPSMKNMPVKTADQNATGNLAFGGFSIGLEYAAIDGTWSATDPGHFVGHFTVPKTAWLTPHGIHDLKDGSYVVAINCFVFGAAVKGCSADPDQAQATFTLTHVSSTTTPAPYLHLSPDPAKPGQTVHVSGWAPLTEIIGVPFPYNFTWSQEGQSFTPVNGTLSQSLTGKLSGSFEVPVTNAGHGLAHVGLQYYFSQLNTTISLAATPFHVQAPLNWADLAIPHTVVSASNAEPIAKSGSFMALPSQNPGVILVSHNGARSWQTLHVTGIGQVSEQLGYPVDWQQGQKSPEVSSALVDQRFPDSLFITTAAILKQYKSAPPIFYTPYESTDNGAHWRPVPIPHGFTQGDFGGFFTSSGRVEATWVRASSIAIEVTSNGGVSWHRSALLPLNHGLPVQFGPFADQYPGMGADINDPVLRQDHHRWVTSTTVEATVAAAPASQLDRLREGTLLLNPQSPYDAEITTNRGISWQYVSLPQIPGGFSGQHLLMLANGDLVATNANGRWYVLLPHKTAWQPVPQTVLPQSIEVIEAVGPVLWWYENGPSSAREAAVDIHHTQENQL
ncbi:MAG: hypothetical protein C7B45_14350 [Sulfobacillus acidophilus]|uniref:Exo-alpha-sialidase n=1 Tax=Sulfobacillus acidophilus TaxID=53633 RepID=A0A2T2WEB8_9FIRM|nr:MAG: hypothetical protein C7B45_14350 [Sulfobacillus acidophilus]